MNRRIALAVASAVAVVALLAPSSASAIGRSGARSRALDYLHARQYANGGFGEAGRGSSEQLTAWGIVAITAAGENPNTWRRGPNSPVTYLSRQSSRWKSTTDYARTLLAAVAAGHEPRWFGGVDLVAKVTKDITTDGSHGDRIGPAINSHIWGMIALRAAGRNSTSAEIRWLKNQQNKDGGWGWGIGVASDSNDTAAAIQALVANGESRGSQAVKKAITYLRSKQRGDGGFSYGGGASDTGSTSWAIQALAAAREQSTGPRWRKNGNTPVSRLCGLQRVSGAMRYTASSTQNPLFMTVQAIPALALRGFPVRFSPSLRNSLKAGPVVRLVRPAPNSSLPRGSRVGIRFRVVDTYGTGLQPGSVRVKVDGATRSARVSGTSVDVAAGLLPTGAHSVSVRASDRAGNSSSMSGWRFAVGTQLATASLAQAVDPESGTMTTATPQGGLTGTSTPDGSLGATAAPGSTGVVPPEQVPGSGQATTGNVDNWGSAVEVEPPSSASTADTAKKFGTWALVALAFFIPTVAAIGLIAWIGNRRAKRAKRKRAEQALGQPAPSEQAQTPVAGQQATEAQAGAPEQAAGEQAEATQQWTPEQIAAWQVQQQAAAQQAATQEAVQEQQWTPEQLAAWQAQQQAANFAQQQTPTAPYEQMSPEQEAAWQAWEAQGQAPQQAPPVPQAPAVQEPPPVQQAPAVQEPPAVPQELGSGQPQPPAQAQQPPPPAAPAAHPEAPAPPSGQPYPPTTPGDQSHQ